MVMTGPSREGSAVGIPVRRSRIRLDVKEFGQRWVGARAGELLRAADFDRHAEQVTSISMLKVAVPTHLPLADS